MDVNTLPAAANGWLVPDDPASLAVVLSQPVPGPLTLNVAGRLAVPGVVDTTISPGQCWRWRLTVAQVAVAVGPAPAANYTTVPFRITTGTGDDLTSLVAGSLDVVDRWRAGGHGAALQAAVLIGPAGAGADADTVAGLVSDYLAGHPSAALQTHIDSPAPHPVYDDLPGLSLIFDNALI